ncbi:MAG TPA: cation transporter, partial [Acetobacteraceae bacterium]|nr:cation transporter [Acetobacteraceae bacterium]
MPDATATEAARPGAALLRYRVSGMDCPSCAGKIETALQRLHGTGDIRINFHTQMLALRLDEAATSRDRIEASLRQLGFGIAPADVSAFAADPVEAGDRQAVPAWLAWLRTLKARLTLAIGLLLIAGFVVARLQPGIGHWAYLPAALLGLAFFGRRAVALARA